MIRRISPSTTSSRSSSSSSSSKKSVSFGESVVHQVEKTAPEEAPEMWYHQDELDQLRQAERIVMWEQQKKKKPDDSFTMRGLETNKGDGKPNHVRHVVKVYRLKQKKAPMVDPEELRKTSQHSSRNNAKFALKQGRRDFVDAHGKGRFMMQLGRLFRH